MANVVNSGAMDEFLKENVYPELMEAINLRTVERKLFAGIQKGAVEGKWFRISMLTKGNFRFEGRGERDTLPGKSTITNANDVPADIDGIEAKFYRKQMYSIVQVSGPAYRAGMGAGGFEEMGKLILKQTMEGLPESVSRQWATGQAVPLARVNTSTPLTTTLTLTPATGITNETDAFPWLGNRYLREGMVVDFVATGSGLLGAIRLDTAKKERGRSIAALSDDTTTATATLDTAMSAANNIAAGDIVVPFNTRDGGSTDAITANSSMESKWTSAMGILDAVQNSTDSHYSVQYYGQLDRTAAGNRVLQSRIQKNTTLTALTVAQINQLLERIRLDPLGPGTDPDVYYTHPSVWRKFIDGNNVVSFTSNNPARFNNPGAGFKPSVGVESLGINSIGAAGQIEVVTSPMAPMYRFYAVAKKYLMQIEEGPLGPLDLDGLTWRMASGSTDDWNMFLGWYCTGIVNRKPNASGYICGLTGDQNTA